MWQQQWEQLSNLERDVSWHKTNVENNAWIPANRIPAAILNLPGVQNEIDKAKSTVEQSLDTIRRKTAEVKAIADQEVAESSRLQRDIAMRRNESNTYEKSVNEANTLATIRKEQAEALKQKYDANYHSSWLGLMRPLSEESRVGLFISAIVFGLIAIFSLLYYIYAPVSGGAATAIASGSYNLFGGAWKRLTKLR